VIGYVKLSAVVSALVDTAKEEVKRVMKKVTVIFGEALMVLLEILQIKDLLN
jgi:hypothetical protein